MTSNKRTISQVMLDKQATFKPFVIKPKHNDIRTEWVKCEGFPQYEIRRSGEVRNISSQDSVTVYNSGFLHLKKEDGTMINKSHAQLLRETFGFDKIDGEFWCELAEYPDIIVSNMGRVAHKQKLTLYTGTNDRGYLSIKLKHVDIGERNETIQRLVALAFIGPPPSEFHKAIHINKNKSDNRVQNLQYAILYGELQRDAIAPPKTVHEEKDYNLDYSKEEWKLVPFDLVGGVHDIYYVSNCGRVSRKNKIKQLTINEDGYKTCGFCVDGVEQLQLVHRIVATAFIPNPENKPQVDHINFDPQCNAVWNLQWLTNQENAERSFAKPVSCYDPDTEDTVEFKSVVDAARQVFPDDPPLSIRTAIARVCRGEENRTQYRGLYWWYHIENPNGLEKIKAKIQSRSRDHFVPAPNAKVTTTPLHSICLAHQHCRNICNFDSEFELKATPFHPVEIDKNGLRWIRIPSHPGYKISETKRIKQYVNDIEIKVSDHGQVNLSRGDVRGNTGVAILFRSCFGFEAKELIPGELWKHSKIASQYIVSTMGRIINCENLEFLYAKDEAKKQDVRLNKEAGETEAKKMCLAYVIADAFVAKTDPSFKKIVYKDGNIKNYRADNLQWATKMSKPQRPDAKTTGRKVLQLDPTTKKVLNTFSSQAAAAKSVGASASGLGKQINQDYIFMGYYWKNENHDNSV